MELVKPDRTRGTILWETPNGLRCISTQREEAPPFEITIAHGDKILTRAAFHAREHVREFAMAANEECDNLRPW